MYYLFQSGKMAISWPYNTTSRKIGRKSGLVIGLRHKTTEEVCEGGNPDVLIQTLSVRLLHELNEENPWTFWYLLSLPNKIPLSIYKPL